MLDIVVNDSDFIRFLDKIFISFNRIRFLITLLLSA